MGAHPFRQSRITQAQTHTGEIITAMRSGDWEKFGAVLEAEALSLHAMMMTSRPSFILLAPKSLTAMEKIRAFRAQSGLPVYFTIDAGPNIHLIYPKHHETDVEDFIKTDLAALCQDGAFIIDECGAGATVTGHANV